jgi:chemotaxis protein CheD
MNHFLLPSRTRGNLNEEDIVLNGDYAMEVLANAMYSKGAQKQRLIAKAFGGGTIVSSIQMAIGQRNAEFAAEWLAREGIPLAAKDFGGPWSRKVILDPESGDALCRRTSTGQRDVQDMVVAEAEYEKSLIASKPSGPRVELF